MSRPVRARSAAVVAAVLASLLAGCVGMPEDGPVVETERTGMVQDERATAIDPLPPAPGASMTQIAQGFLEAMTATPARSSVVAQEYLSRDARASWDPDQATIVYADTLSPRVSAGVVTLPLVSAERLDQRGAWVGALDEQDSRLRLRMVREDGELRIVDPPDALVVPSSWFAQRFREVSLYFFDRTGQILVPESVFVPRGRQLASTLTAGLLAGPPERPGQVTRTFIPDGLQVGLSVPIDADGVAELDLTGDTPPRTGEAGELMLAQLEWTLRQDPSIEALRVSIAGQSVSLPGDIDEFRVDDGAVYSPTGYQASTLLYGLDRSGRVVSGSAETLSRVSGPLGAQSYGLRSVAIDLYGSVVAGVGGGGTTVLRAPVRQDETPQSVEQILTGATDLLPPTWDFSGRLWLLDRTSRGARVLYLDTADAQALPRELEVPGITGRDVRGFLVSRDSTRIVAVVHGASSDRLSTARVKVSENGRVRRAVRGTEVAPETGGQVRVRDLVWTTPTSVALMSGVRRDLLEVREVIVDGAPSGLSTLATTVKGPVRAMAGTPVEDQPTLVLTGSNLVDVGVGGVLGPGVPLRDVTYAG